MLNPAQTTRKLLAAGGVTIALLVSACASSARPELMTVAAGAASASPAEPAYKAVRVGSVSGGGETNAMWMSNVSAADFQAALEASLRATNYLTDTADGAQYEVSARLEKVDRPMAGISMTTATTVGYTVKSLADGKVVFQDLVAATGTAKMGEAFLGVERLRLANEASVRENIKAFIERFRRQLAAPSER